jgi:peptidoglycan lytic transglycosylase
LRRFAATLLVVLLAACGSAPQREPAPGASTRATPPGATGGGRYYKDDGPGANPPANLDAIPDAVPRLEPLHRFANRPYNVLGREYVPATSLKAYRERGVASWYGRKFHGQKTSIGETYDMYAMTAAHPTLPLPSYARVTNLANGRSVIVRVNDRGPFLNDRLIDLSYAAAHRLGIAQRGSGEVEVEAILPGTVAPSDVIVADASPGVTTAPLAAAALPVAQPVPAAQPVPDSRGLLPPVADAPLVSPPAEVALVQARAPIPGAAPPPPSGYAVQLGAFASYPNALDFLAHVQNQLAGARVEARVRQAGGLYRVYVGPYADRDEARRVGERITHAFGFATVVAPH